MTYYDIGIIGAGVYGTMIALELAQAGKSVILFDKHEYGHAQASSSALTRAGHSLYDNADYHALAVQSLALYRSEFQDSICDTPAVLFAENGDGQTHAQKVMAQAQHRALSREDTVKAYPDFKADYACEDAQGGVIRMNRVREQLYERLEKSRISTVFHSDITRIIYGDKTHIHLSDGREYECQKLVLCAGYKIDDVMKRIENADVPDLGIKRVKPGALIHLKPQTEEQRQRVTCGAMPAFAYIEKGMFGLPIVEGTSDTVKIASFYDPSAQDFTGVEPYKFIKEYLPFLHGFEESTPDIKDQCEYDYTGDGHFIVGNLEKAPNLFLACGWNGSGYKFAPILSRRLSEHILTGHSVLPEIFSPDRLYS